MKWLSHCANCFNSRTITSKPLVRFGWKFSLQAFIIISHRLKSYLQILQDYISGNMIIKANLLLVCFYNAFLPTFWYDNSRIVVRTWRVLVQTRITIDNERFYTGFYQNRTSGSEVIVRKVLKKCRSDTNAIELGPHHVPLMVLVSSTPLPIHQFYKLSGQNVEKKKDRN